MEPLDTIVARITYLARHSGVDPTALSRYAGLAQNHVRILMSGKVANPDSNTCVGIARACGVPTDWLLMGHGPIPDPDAIQRHVAIVALGYKTAAQRRE